MDPSETTMLSTASPRRVQAPCPGDRKPRLLDQIGDLGDAIRARKPNHLPVVMTRDEVKAAFSHRPRRQRREGPDYHAPDGP